MGKQVDNTFNWVIKNVSSSQRIVSKPFIVGGCKWRLKADPRVMNDADHYMSLWIYLEVVDCEPLPSGWKMHAKSSITIVNQYSEERSHRQETQQWFTERTIGRGFSPMINLLDFSKEYDGFLVDDEVIVVVVVDVLEVICPLDASAKSETISDNGFGDLSSEVKKVKGLFESHPDVASGFRIKNQSLKASYMNVLLNLTETLHQAPKGISKDDLSDAETTLVNLKNVGFKVDWLDDKLDELLSKDQKKATGTEIRIHKIEEEIKDLEQKFDEAKWNILIMLAFDLVIFLVVFISKI